MDKRLKELLEWLARNQSGNPYAHKDPWHPLPKGSMHNLPEIFPKGWTPDSRRKLHKDDSGIWKGPHKLPKGWTPDNRISGSGAPDDYFKALLNKAQVGSAMPKLHKSIDPLSQYPHYGGTPDRRRGFREENVDYYSPSAVDEAGMTEGMITWGKTPTGRNTRSSAHPLSTADLDTLSRENRVAREQAAVPFGVPEIDRKFVDTMHSIQNAYFTGADFGYEEGWTERLGATQEQIDMFMAVPEEALQHAMDNPTDAVLQQFEEYYGFPLNVNDPDMQKYFEDRKKKR